MSNVRKGTITLPVVATLCCICMQHSRVWNEIFPLFFRKMSSFCCPMNFSEIYRESKSGQEFIFATVQKSVLTSKPMVICR